MTATGRDADMERNPVTTECVIDACIPRDGMERIERILSWAEGVDWAPSEEGALISALHTLVEDARTIDTDAGDDPGDYSENEDRMLSLIGEVLSGYGYMIELDAGDVLVIPCDDDREDDA